MFRVRHRLGLAIVAAISVVGSSVAIAGPASAATASPAQCYRYAANAYHAWDDETWPGGADWSVTGWGPAPLSMSRSETVSNSYTASISVPDTSVSAAVGFSVTWSGTVGSTYTIQIPAGQEWQISAGYVSGVYHFDINLRCGATVQNVGSGYAYQYYHLTYMNFRIA